MPGSVGLESCGTGLFWVDIIVEERKEKGEKGKASMLQNILPYFRSVFPFYHSQRIILSVIDENDKSSSCQNLVINLHAYIAASSSFFWAHFRGAVNATYQCVGLRSENLNKVCV